VGAGLVVLALLPLLAGPPKGRAVERSGGFAHGRLNTWEAAVETAAERPVLGAGAEAFYTASAVAQGESRARYAFSLPLESAVELGIAGLLLSLALLVFVGKTVWGARASPALWLLGPAAAGFAVTNLLDWPWHLPGAGAIWAAALGGLIGATGQRAGAYG
jgi:O-antigen ligase